MESFIPIEFYNFLVSKGIKKSTFSPIFNKNTEIPVFNDEMLVISKDDLHPNELGHRLWTEEILIPHRKGLNYEISLYGDSYYTYGYQDKVYGIPLENRWSSLLSDRLNLKEVNNSVNGSSNSKLSKGQ